MCNDESHMPTPKLPVAARNQRIIFLNTTGPYAGLHQIGGHTDDFPATEPMPPALGPFDTTGPTGRTGLFAGLKKSTPRWLLYAEIAPKN